MLKTTMLILLSLKKNSRKRQTKRHPTRMDILYLVLSSPLYMKYSTQPLVMSYNFVKELIIMVKSTLPLAKFSSTLRTIEWFIGLLVHD